MRRPGSPGLEVGAVRHHLQCPPRGGSLRGSSNGALKLALLGAKSGSLQRSGCSFQADRRRLWASQRCLEAMGRAAANHDLCAFGHLFFAPQRCGVTSPSASCRARGLIFDSRICLLEASERFRSCLPALSRERAVPACGSGLRKRFASRVVSGARSRGVCVAWFRPGRA